MILMIHVIHMIHIPTYIPSYPLSFLSSPSSNLYLLFFSINRKAFTPLISQSMSPS